MMRFFSLVLLLLCGFSAIADSNTSNYDALKTAAIQELAFQDTAEHQQLVQAKALLQEVINKQAQRFVGDERLVSDAELAAALVSCENTEAYLGSTRIAIADVSESINLANLHIEKIKEQQQKAEIRANHQRLSLLKIRFQQEKKVLSFQRSRLTTLKELVKVWQQIQRLHKNNYNQLVLLHQQQERNQRVEALLVKIHHLQREQNGLLQQVDALKSATAQQSMRDNNASIDPFLIYSVQEKITLNRLALFLTQLQVRAEDFLPHSNDAVKLEELVDRSSLKTLLRQLSEMKGVVANRINYINNHVKLLSQVLEKNQISNNASQKVLKELSQTARQYGEYLQQLGTFQQKILLVEKNTKQQYKSDLYQRESLPGLTWVGWKNLGDKLLDVPRLMLKYFSSVAVHIFVAVTELSTFFAGVLLLSSLALIVAGLYLRHYLRHIIRYLNLVSQRFSQNLFKVVFKLVKRSLLLFILISYLVVLDVSLDIDLSLFIDFLLLIIAVRVILNVARGLFIDGFSKVVQKNKRTYYRLHSFFVAATILFSCVLVTHHLPVDEEIRGLFNRLFMIILLILSLFLFQAWVALPLLLKQVFSVRRKYILNAIRLFCRVFPVTLLSNAIIGLIGYVQLAWLIGMIQAVALVVLFGFLVARGLIFDFIELCYELTIRHVKNGWLWAQVILKPLDKILRLGLVVVAIWILIAAYQLDDNQKFVFGVHKILTVPLMHLGDNVINIEFLLKTSVFIAILYWVAKWSREFAFRSLYVHARDIGVRNSLSVFTQYTVVIIGVVIGLRFLGVDLKGLAVVAAAFAAGIGFGLRDLLSNFFSGILLLVERPFRTGDRITLGQYEGQIISTGMRSMKIRTWDHMEVIVPNSDMFTKPFVNWTHQDSIVRSVVKIRLDRIDDPRRVRDLIYGMLKELSFIVDDPAPEVFMKELSDALLEMEVRYFINLQIESSRARIRSEVLFAIWECFKTNNIHPPYPHIDMQLYNNAVQQNNPSASTE